MQATTTASKALTGEGKAIRQDRERIADGVLALMRYLWEFDRGAGYLAAVEESGMTLPQLKALITLAGVGEGPCPVKNLAEQLGLSAPAATRIVDALFERGLATRTEDPEDRRVRLIAITASGRKFVEEFAHRRTEGIEALADRMTPAQRRKLIAAFDALLENDSFRRAYESNRRAARK
jgi:DNA-binding MarR family transcriptional regulator